MMMENKQLKIKVVMKKLNLHIIQEIQENNKFIKY